MKKNPYSYLEYVQSLDPNMHVVDTSDASVSEEEILQYLAEIIISIHYSKVAEEKAKEESITQNPTLFE